jgi:bifunctional DNA-binding transcriptional regulator/antitoxin component of YhaV-PrlF toxin-antitoxin module
MVIPKEARAKAGIQAGDKLALVGWRRGGRVCCFSLIKAEEMAEMLGELVGALMAAAPPSKK